MTASDLLAAAARLDAEGRHEQALQSLIAAAQSGAATAYTLLGKRYLVGDRATRSPPSAIQLLQQAVELGDGEAAAQLAVLHALGIHLPQDWNQCLSLLVFAATCGWQDAREQLQLLAGDQTLAARPGDGQDHWLALARSIDLAHWHHSAPHTLLCEGPRIGRVANLVNAPICRWLQDKGRSRLAPALVYDAVQRREIRHPTRSNSSAILGLCDTSVLLTLLQIRIASSMGVALRQLEAAAVLHYKGQEEIRNHYDFIDPAVPGYAEQIRERGDRIITFLVYLNDDYGGGETDFPEAGIRHKGVQGEGLFFVNVGQDARPDLRTVHAGLPPTSGEKWVITQFIRDKPTF